MGEVQDWNTLEGFVFGNSETLDDWRAGHWAYFTRNGSFAPDMLLWCERFRLVEILGEGADR